MNAPEIDSWGDFFGYTAIGAAGGAIGMAGTPANWALNTAIGAAQGATVGGLNASLTEGDLSAFGGGAKTGVLWGGAAGFASSEAPQNLIRGDGFKNNLTLYNEWNNGTVEGYDKIARRFGDGEFLTASNEFWENNPTARALTHPTTGAITYNEMAFESNLDFCKSVRFHEGVHSAGVLSGKVLTGSQEELI